MNIMLEGSRFLADYLVFYQEQSKGVPVIRLLPGARDLPPLTPPAS